MSPEPPVAPGVAPTSGPPRRRVLFDESVFEVVVTTDRTMRYQQNIPASGLALLVLRAPSSRVADLLRVVPALLAALPAAAPGTVAELRAAS